VTSEAGERNPGASEPGERDTLVCIRGLTFRRGPRPVFERVNMDIPRGGITAIMGPSGSGKTTLLKLIAGQLTPEAGRIDVDGAHVHGLDRAGLFALRKRIGMLFQSGALLTDLSVYDNVAFPLREHTPLPEALVRQLVLLRLESVGLRGARDLMPSELSGGMARRVALARALVLDPAMILYDEPFTGQDPISMGVLVQLIRSVNDALGLSSIVVSHDVGETLSIADYAYVVADGEVVGRGTPQQLRASQSPWIRQFVQALPDGPVPFHYPGASVAEELFDHGR
jgi:phospholipid/cholesterol/gamma-HCH transport system ATP-binding protein